MDEDEAIILLNKYASDEEAFEKILAHAQAVKEVALKITQEILEQGFFVDIDLVQSGALLHDIGRFEYPPGSDKMYRHGLVGSDILRKEGHPQEALIAERHLGPGISREEILEQDLDLPHQDFIPESYEEKSVCYADK